MLDLADIRGVLERDREFAHGSLVDHDISELLQAPEDIVLDVRHVVLLADLQHDGGGLLVREHGEVRPQVVLDLVVQPPVHEIAKVSAYEGRGGGSK